VKANADCGLRFTYMGPMDQLRIGCYWDASWATRPDGTSQGGYIIFLTNQESIDTGKPVPLVVLDYASKKLVRICRSSLSGEAQAAALAIDNLEWVKIFWTLTLYPNLAPDGEHAATACGMSPCFTDSRGLYDAGRSQSAGLGITEKRTAIEVSMVNDRMAAINGEWRWTSAHQQLADGLTKVSARQKLADIMRRGMHALKFDESFTSLKKLTQKQKDARERELDLAADSAMIAETSGVTGSSVKPDVSETSGVTGSSVKPDVSSGSTSSASLPSSTSVPSTSLPAAKTKASRPSRGRLWGHEKILAAVLAAQRLETS
jgi:hypothetical protein